MAIRIRKWCPFCATQHSVWVEDKDNEAYEAGALVQRAFPYLNATQREQLISGICPKCQESIFGVEE